MPLVFRNNSRIGLGSKSEKFKNIEDRKHLGVLKKKECSLGQICSSLQCQGMMWTVLA